jgi:glucokinase
MSKFAIGIDLGGTNLKGIIMDQQGHGRHVTRIPTEAHRGGSRVMENILRLIDELIAKEGSKEHLLGVGIGTPGFVGEDGMLLGGAENLPGWKGTQIYVPIRQRFNLPAVAANDVTVMALAESRFGAARDVKNVICLAMGTGIGGGIVIDGRLYKGTHGMAGELGHVSVDPEGLPCNCGQKGCIERYASANGVAEMAIRMCKEAMEQTAFVELVRSDESGVTSKLVYDYVCRMLARAVGMYCNIFAPDRIVLGGGLMMAGRVILDEVVKHAGSYCFSDIWERCKVVIAECGEDAGVMGAAAMVFDEFSQFQGYQIVTESRTAVPAH